MRKLLNIFSMIKVFSHVISLLRHSSTHSREKPFKCDLSDKCFPNKLFYNLSEIT